jgi:glycosyltransferase involved in cell wall biosynthesis
MISVIIPCYNSSGTVTEALGSVLSQDYTDMEIIVVDDGSNDDTVDTVISYQKAVESKSSLTADSVPHSPWATEDEPRLTQIIKDANTVPPEAKVKNSSSITVHHCLSAVTISNSFPIRLLRMAKNGGVAAARNAGIKAAKGKWIAFLDADDVWKPGKLKAQKEFLSSHPDVDMLCGGTIPVDSKQLSVVSEEKNLSHKALKVNRTSLGALSELSGEESYPLSDSEFQISSFKQIPLKEFALRNPVATSTVIVRKSALEAVGGFDEQFCGPEDYDLWMRIAVNHTIARMDAPLTLYRSESGSLSMDDRKFLPQVLRVIEKSYGQNGALENYAYLYKTSVSNQYWNAAWMAFNRGARPTALRYWRKAWFLNLFSSHRIQHKWWRILFRYFFRNY